MESIRGSALLQFDQMLAEHGAVQQDFLVPLKIGLEVVGNYGKTLPYLNLVRLFEGSAHALSLPRFGLELAVRQGSTLVGPLQHLAKSAPTVGHALIAVIRYMRHYSPALHYRLERRAAQALLYFDNGLPSSEQTPQIIEKSIMGAKLLIAELRGVPLRPKAVMFRHSALGDAKGYARYFDCPVLFGQPHNCLVMSADILQEATGSHDATLHAIVRHYLENQAVACDSLRAQVERKIQMLLPNQRCSLEQVALALELNPRTLQRRLASDGIDFEGYLDDLRRQQAQQMLRSTTLSVGQISSELGYRRTTSFCRAHLRWFDMTPLEHRRLHGDPMIAKL
ncbi:AraC family transcriptional regulator ligand-binding domain-containing protein [Pseudomonas sp. DCB_AW]|jgi:AraC-like DNA-binding protein|uniref:AraC family transcriptional regulator n=1 Tax=Pseudomonas sp. DCB_AW TaxID=2993596 RepID=UPI0022494A2F|nr:AraC family transcriptional regulator [Pseudomonas sp. DCB_AW]MCX2688071.1 AraC family transcriptional regulator ligand-binding domain-containing protein [Pseudomonas sp. DCB_AW]